MMNSMYGIETYAALSGLERFLVHYHRALPYVYRFHPFGAWVLFCSILFEWIFRR